ncbi:hypothetical protein JCM15519_15290 [Fundidesulfovibrio butyratiphilus]
MDICGVEDLTSRLGLATNRIDFIYEALGTRVGALKQFSESSIEAAMDVLADAVHELRQIEQALAKW